MNHVRLFRTCLLLAGGFFTAFTALAAAPPGPPTVADAETFIARAESRLKELWISTSRISWVKANFITEDTDILEAQANEELLGVTGRLATEAARFDRVHLPEKIRRKLNLLKISLPLAAPRDAARRKELAMLASEMESLYGRGQVCGEDGACKDLTELTRIMARSRDAAELLKAWRGWRTISRPMRPMYRRFSELGNEGARQLGFPNLGALWRAGYDMPPNQVPMELDRLWAQVRPLYEALHCHVRASLVRKYGPGTVPPEGPIPAHLLGNMWAQQWNNIYDLVAPPEGGTGYDLTELLKARRYDSLKMVRRGEQFFTSLGFTPLPDTFWKRSLFTKPADRDVVCHASAWDIDSDRDVRIKMCIEITGEDFRTIHHELGHNFYQRAYRHQDPLFQDGANDGFHEGIGDTIALSITPEYLHEIGLLDHVPGPEGDLGLLMHRALDKVAFLPFGLLVDQWRWKVFSGEIEPAHYNRDWWRLRLKYQGIAPPVPRTETDFDPGAKYHVPANTPYTRYFLAHILQFQFHRALCKTAGFEGPLHRCSIYGNAAAGKKLREMLEMGRSRPWPEALARLTGEDHLDATAILDYFAPLKTWLDEQNQGRSCGWNQEDVSLLPPPPAGAKVAARTAVAGS